MHPRLNDYHCAVSLGTVVSMPQIGINVPNQYIFSGFSHSELILQSFWISFRNLLMKMQFDNDSQILSSCPLLFHCWKEKLSLHLMPVNVVSNCQARFMNTHCVYCSLFLLGFVRLAGGDDPAQGE